MYSKEVVHLSTDVSDLNSYSARMKAIKDLEILYCKVHDTIKIKLGIGGL